MSSTITVPGFQKFDVVNHNVRITCPTHLRVDAIMNGTIGGVELQ